MPRQRRVMRNDIDPIGMMPEDEVDVNRNIKYRIFC
jgi:hypothetical protein